MSDTRPKYLPALALLSPSVETAYRAAVIKEAYRWLDTPYRQCSATVGAGVDCSMLLVRATVEAGVFEEFDPRPYPPMWHLHRSDEKYLAWLNDLGEEVDTPQPGDVIAYKFGRCFAHGGIMSEPGWIIHAWSKAGKCDRNEMFMNELMFMNDGSPRPVKYFDIFARARAK